MREILDIVLKFKGILWTAFIAVFGTAFGAVVVLIITNILKNMGITYFYFPGWNIRYTKDDGAGGQIEMPNSDEATNCNYFFEMEIINTAENLKALRDIKVKFYNGNKLLLETIPSNDSTKITSEAGTTSNLLKIINLPSKLLIHYKVSGYIQDEDFKKLKNYNKIYLEAFNYRGKRIKKLIGRS